MKKLMVLRSVTVKMKLLVQQLKMILLVIWILMKNKSGEFQVLLTHSVGS